MNKSLKCLNFDDYFALHTKIYKECDILGKDELKRSYNQNLQEIIINLLENINLEDTIDFDVSYDFGNSLFVSLSFYKEDSFNEKKLLELKKEINLKMNNLKWMVDFVFDDNASEPTFFLTNTLDSIVQLSDNSEFSLK